MGTKTVAFRLNSKSEDDKEIMEWLDDVLYKYSFFETQTEAVKCALLAVARGEVKTREEMNVVETMQEFVRDYAKQSKVDNEKIMQEAVTRILATIVGVMGYAAHGNMFDSLQAQGISGVACQMLRGVDDSEQKQSEEENMSEYNLKVSDKPLDDGSIASLTAMFGDDD